VPLISLYLERERKEREKEKERESKRESKNCRIPTEEHSK
jgi:hypothetical protein